ncbi:hypothetical protein [Nocardioides sp. WS12]|uniref:hypothetical protein n=1 Tax=Nocardioides sp. WS12 TaxID=2486272 RepID=UPI0015FE44D7|nr:hypothetical protein [Nocardioides sp. WS12]
MSIFARQQWSTERSRSGQTIPIDADVRIAATGPLTHLCPVVDEVDEGRVTITWQCNGATLELHALAEYLRGFKDARVSHEQITDRIGHDLSVVDGIELVSVESTWTTAGMEVRCVSTPTPARVTP